MLRHRRDALRGIQDGQQALLQGGKAGSGLQLVGAGGVLRPHPLQGFRPGDVFEPEIGVLIGGTHRFGAQQ